MDGITVLNEYFIESGFVGVFQYLCTLLLLLSVYMFYLCHVNYSKVLFVIGILSALFAMIFMIASLYLSKQPSTIKEYQVTISENVSMTEFMSEYDVIKVDGKIYTIREREK